MNCFSSALLCAVRSARLDANGNFATGADGLSVTDQAIELRGDPIVSRGSQLEQKNGCDQVCFKMENPDRVTGYTLRAQLCALDAELFEMWTGGTLLVENGDTVGYEIPASDATLNGVSIEGWAYAWNGEERALKNGAAAYWRHVFPKVVWTPGGIVLNNGLWVVEMTGKASKNGGFDTGPACDLPAIISEAYAFYFDDAVPDAACGSQTLAACAS